MEKMPKWQGIFFVEWVNQIMAIHLPPTNLNPRQLPFWLMNLTNLSWEKLGRKGERQGDAEICFVPCFRKHLDAFDTGMSV